MLALSLQQLVVLLLASGDLLQLLVPMRLPRTMLPHGEHGADGIGAACRGRAATS